MSRDAISPPSAREQEEDQTPAPPVHNLCEKHCVRQYSFCAALDQAGLDALLQISSQRTLKAGQCLFEEGDRVIFLYNLLEGTLRQIKLMPDGRRQVAGFLHPGDFIGLAHEDTYAHTVEAICDASLCAFPADKLRALMHRFPGMESKFLSMASRELRAEQDHSLLLGRKTARERVASFLAEINQCQERYHNGSGRIYLPMTRSDIADYLGLTIETVSRTVTSLARQGLIELVNSHEVVIRDWRALESVASGRKAPRS